MVYGVLILIWIAIGSKYRSPKLNKNKYLMVNAILLCLAVAKNLIWPMDANVYAIFSFSILWSIAQAIGCWAVLAWQHQMKSRLFWTTLFVMLVSSYSRQTAIFLPALILYTYCLIMAARTQSHVQRDAIYIKPSQLYWMMLILGFVFAGSITGVLAYYREELNNWHPFSEAEEYQSTGFSSYTKLGSRNLHSSDKLVMRYFAPSARYYLRGKALNYYENSQWLITDEQSTAIQGVWETAKVYHFSIRETSDETLPELHKIIRWEDSLSVIFAPLGCKKVTLIGQRGPIYVNQEQALWGPLYLSSSILLEVDSKSGLQKLDDPARYLQIPEKIKQQLDRFNHTIGGMQQPPEEQVKTLCKYLRENYQYSTKVRLNADIDPILDFLTHQKAGHCELFASAFVMLARARGIASRYVIGYYAHEWNSVGNFLSVRECDAHAWAEVFFPNAGWKTIEPTPGAALQETLDGYRGFKWFWLDAMQEQIRDLWEQMLNFIEQHILFWITSLLALLAFAICAIFAKSRSKHHPKTSRKIHGISPQMRELVDHFVKITQVEPRKPAETMREWIIRISPSLSPNLAEYAQALVQEVEKTLYQESPISPHSFQEFKKKWHKIR